MSDVPCAVDDCGRRAWADGLCFGHYKRRQRGGRWRVPLQDRANTPWQGLENAINAFADAAENAPQGDAVKAWKRVKGRLTKAINRYVARTQRWRRKG